MRHTLIPPQERIIVHREYHTRAIIVLLSGLSLAVVVGIISIFPAYISAWTADRTAAASVTSAQNSKDGAGLSRIEAELAADGQLLAALAKDHQAPRFSDVIREIAGARSSVTVSSFRIERTGTSTMTAILQGVAPTRANLLAFKARLEELTPGAVVDLPIEELKKSTNVQFSLRLIRHLP